MKRRIDSNKIKNFLKNKQKKQIDLAKFINYPESNLCSCLKDNSDRDIPMGYVIGISEFFKVEPIDLTVLCIDSSSKKIL